MDSPATYRIVPGWIYVEDPGYVSISSRFLADPSVSANATLVGAYLANASRGQSSYSFTLEDLAKNRTIRGICHTKKRIEQSLEELVAGGWMTKES